MMEPILDTFTIRVGRAALGSPTIPFVSNVTGTWIRPEEATDPAYWARHLRQTVLFSDCLGELMQESNRILLEVGPGRTLATLAKQHPTKIAEHVVLSSLRHPKEEKPDLAFVLGTLGQLWMAGAQIDWSGFYEVRDAAGLPCQPIPLSASATGSARRKQPTPSLP
jgi:acyl transferase domain-containing protein